MTQEALVIKNLPDHMAEVLVIRASACGGNCASCGGCKEKRELRVPACNPIGALPGQRVILETESPRIFGAIFLVYLLPMLGMILGYLVPALSGAGEGLCVLGGFGGFALGVLLMLLVYRLRRRQPPITHTITRVLEGA